MEAIDVESDNRSRRSPALVIAAVVASLMLGCSGSDQDTHTEPDPTNPNGEEPNGGDPTAPNGEDPNDPEPCGPANCQGCCARSGDCVAGADTHACGSNGAGCVDCGPGNACGAGHICEPGSPTSGNDCSNPVSLSLVNGRASVQATLQLENGLDSTLSCAVTGGPDRVFQVQLPSAGSLVARVKPAGTLAVAVAVRSECDAAQTERACGAGGRGEEVEIVASTLDAGSAFVWVVADQSSHGDFTLEVEHIPAQRVACEGATEIVLVGNSATVAGSYTGSSPKVPSCGGSSEGVMYEFETHQAGTISAVARSRGGGFLTLDLARDCSGNTPLECKQGGTGVPCAVRLPNAQPGRYALAVSGSWVFGSDQREFDLEVRVDPTPPNRACASATSLVFTDDVATVTGSTHGALNDHFSFCLNYFGSEGQDVFYTFELLEPRSVRASVVPDAEESRPTLSLRRGSCGGHEVDCGLQRDGQAVIERQALPAGVYYLMVDSEREGPGPFTLTVELGEAALGESCDMPQPIVFTADESGALVAEANTHIRQHERAEEISCNSHNVNSTDVVFSFSTTQFYDLLAESRWVDSATGIGNLALFRDDCGQEDEIVCARQGLNSKLTRLVKRGLAPGDHLIVMQAFSSSQASERDLTVTLTPPIPGDGCGSPLPLTFVSGRATATGDSSDFFNDVRGSCGGSGPDALYTFSTTEPMGLRAEATTTRQGFTPVLHLMGDPSSCPSGPGIACASGSSGRAFMTKSVLPAGSYLLAVDASSSTGGPFELTVDLAPANEGETCETAIPLTFSAGAAGGTASATGTTVGHFDDLRACGFGGNNPDRVYTFTTDRLLNLTAALTPTGGRTRPFLSLREECEGTSAWCGNAEWDQPSSLRVGGLAPGKYYLVADTAETFSPSGFDFELEAALEAPAPGDICATALPLDLSSGTTTVLGDTTSFFHHPIGCDLSGPDMVYTFTTDRVTNLRATLEKASPESAFGGRILLADSCAIRSGGCWGLQSLTTEAGALRPGTYYLIVDSQNASSAGPFRMHVELTDPQPGDSCELPLPLFGSVPARGTAVVEGDITGAFDNVPKGTCGGTSPGRDVVYAFTTGETMNLRASAVGSSTWNTPDLLLLSGDCESEIACRSTWSGAALVERVDLPPGDYKLVVMSSSYTSSSAGPFTLSVTLEPAAPGDLCRNAIELPIGADGGRVTVSGDTTELFDTVRGVCAASGTNTVAPDQIFTFTTSREMNLRVRARPSGTSWRRIAYVLKDHCDSHPMLCSAAFNNTGPAQGDVGGIPPGTYFVAVDGHGAGAKGAFDLDVAVMPIVPGESCDTPLPLEFVGGEAGATGNIEDWFPDAERPCGPVSARGEDVVYTFSTTKEHYFKASLATPSSDFEPMLFLGTGTCSAAPMACDRGFSASTVEIAERLPAGTHFLTVQGGINRSEGSYLLSAEYGQQPQGDTCQNPLPITLTGGQAVVTGRTHLFLDEGAQSCGGAGARDVYYTFTTNAVGNLTVSVRSPNFNIRPIMALKGGCGETELACVTTNTNSMGTLRHDALPAGTYILVVDGMSDKPGPGDYRLEIDLQ